MANIEIDTLTDKCWQKCDDLDVEVIAYYGDGGIYANHLYCANVDKCKRIEKLIVEGFEDGVTGNE